MLVKRALNLKKTAVYAVAFLILLVVVFIFVYRPWQLTWGATEGEVNRGMVGDDIVENPTFNATRAVTINARPEDIWPWIIQIGYKKAGFYSYDILDNDGIESAEWIIPEYQNLKVGDLIPMSKDINARVAALEPDKYMLMVFNWGNTASWNWGLYKIDTGRTRLVTRLRARHESIITRVLLDTFEIVMMRKCMLGIKRRAESIPFQFGDAEEEGFL
jgi:hypothetical protein